MVRDMSKKARVQPTEEEDPETCTEPRAHVCWMNPVEEEPLEPFQDRLWLWNGRDLWLWVRGSYMHRLGVYG